MTELVLTVDELRGLDRWLTDLSLPWFVTAGDVPDLRVDAAALRGLAARDLAVLHPPGGAGPADDPGGNPDGNATRITLAPPLARRLAPCRGATLLAEVDVEAAGAIARYAVLARADAAATVLTELPGGLVRLAAADAAPEETVRRLCGLAVPQLDTGPDATASVATAAGFSVAAATYAAADDRMLAGDPDVAVTVLVAGGAPEPAARTWVAAVRDRRRAVALRAAVRPGGTGQVHGGELRWLVAADGVLWRIGDETRADGSASPASTVDGWTGDDQTGDDWGGHDWAGEEPAGLVHVSPTSPARLRRAIDALMTIATPAMTREGAA